MEMNEIKLWENGTPFYDEAFGQGEPIITPHIVPGNKKRGCVIVCPGGGYEHLAKHEGGPVAEMFNEAGIHAFVLRYRLAPYRHPVELGDALRAVRYVRYHADEFNVLPDKIAILGFSAGGHLSILACQHFDLPFEPVDEVDTVSSRPDAGLFCYPVVSFVAPWGNRGCGENMLGEDFDEELGAMLSGENSVRDDMPPAFIWHAFEDAVVPISNSLNLALAMEKKKIPVELHIFSNGAHGLGLAPQMKDVSQWARLACVWLSLRGFAEI